MSQFQFTLRSFLEFSVFALRLILLPAIRNRGEGTEAFAAERRAGPAIEDIADFIATLCLNVKSFLAQSRPDVGSVLVSLAALEYRL